jgi:molybdopterin/thiamine biosynthesis adenylyltransferase
VISTLVLPGSLADELNNVASQPVETAGVLLVSVVVVGENQFRLLAREFHPVPEAAYLDRTDHAMSITSAGYVPALARAETIGASALWVHTHPGAGASPSPSTHDDVVDQQLAEPFRLRSGSDYYGALIISPSEAGLLFTGHFAADGCAKSSIARMWQVGDRFRLAYSAHSPSAAPSDLFDRNVRAFGPAVQAMLGDLTVGIAGCGGTGSAVAEQLVRLGVRKFLLVDPDTLSASNTTRVYGSSPAQVGEPKVAVAATNIRRIAPDARCDAVQSMLSVEHVAKRLSSCDIVFGCTDDNAGRLILSRLPTYLLTPVIDCGVLLSSDQHGILTGIDGRVTVIAPEQACLLCRGRIDVARAAAELMAPAERTRLEDEGYAPALGGVEPAVISFTTLVAATAVSELLERLIGYGPTPRPSEILLRCHEREISTNVGMPRPGHYCSNESKCGRGVTEPFLEMVWSS